jgi:hypothetical protein
MKHSLINYPVSPVYEIVPSDDGITHIRVPDDQPKEARKSGLSRRDRALLAADVLQRSVDISTWSVARVAEVFGASVRSTREALSLSPAERNDVWIDRRPLFPRRSSIPEPTLTPAQYLERAIAAFG